MPPRAVFADCHVGRRPGDEGPFLEALEKARGRGVTRITLLGDIFHYFIAHPKFETPAIARFLSAVRGLAAAGVSVTYVEGNRDFFLRGSYVEKEFHAVCDEEIFEAGGRRFLATHGDLLNEKDLPYRFWRRLSKNPVSRFALNFFPKGAGNRLVWKVEARLYRSNFKHKSRLPVEMIRAFAGRRFREGRRRPAARPLPQVVERDRSTAAGSRSCRRSSRSGGGWKSRRTGPRRSWRSERAR